MQAPLILEIPSNFDARYSCLIIHCASSFDSRTAKCRIDGLLNFDLCVHFLESPNDLALEINRVIGLINKGSLRSSGYKIKYTTLII
jgi:hypothetical protein